MHNVMNHPFSQALKEWRKLRKMSQLDLACEADISQKHISWMETGKSQPSRSMVVKLIDALKVPLRQRNQFLKAAGFSELYTQNTLDDDIMQPVNQVLDMVLMHHMPYPAFVLDRLWNIKKQNAAADALFAMAGGEQTLWNAIGDLGKRNIALLSIHPNGIRQMITNWEQLKVPFMLRIKREAFEQMDQEAIAQYELFSQYVELDDASLSMQPMIPVLPLTLKISEQELNLFSVISNFGTAQDITASEMKIETFYPGDKQTVDFFNQH